MYEDDDIVSPSVSDQLMESTERWVHSIQTVRAIDPDAAYEIFVAELDRQNRKAALLELMDAHRDDDGHFDPSACSPDELLELQRIRGGDDDAWILR